MTEPSLLPDQEPMRYPLSFAQEWFLTLDRGDDGGAFGPRFLQVCPVRVSGRVDVPMLQGALDDVVERHELLRTLVVRDADPPYQLVRPPCQVQLDVRDVAPVTGSSRDAMVQDLIAEAEAGTVSAREVPLLRARLCRLDERDSVLILMVHHSASDAWSVQVILRDLGAFYAARAAGVAADLPPAKQYHEYAQWQRANAADPAEGGSLSFWRHNLDGTHEFGAPNDHGHPDSYSQPYSYHAHVIEADIMTGVSALATATRSTQFMIMLSAFYVLASQLTGATDLAIRAFTAGRDDLQFQDTMGLFINVLPFRASLDDCVSFRDIITRARDTFIEAVTHELPVNVIEQAVPNFASTRQDRRTSEFIISMMQGQYGDELAVPIADGAYVVAERPSQESGRHDIPSGMVWNLSAGPSGVLDGGVLYNLDEFDESTVVGWATELRRILAGVVSDPDQDWRKLTSTGPT
jgi:hypothetical protein